MKDIQDRRNSQDMLELEDMLGMFGKLQTETHFDLSVACPVA